MHRVSVTGSTLSSSLSLVQCHCRLTLSARDTVSHVSVRAETKDNTTLADANETTKTISRYACKLHQENYKLFIDPETKPQGKKRWLYQPHGFPECYVGLCYNHSIIAIRTEKVQVMPEEEAEGRY